MSSLSIQLLILLVHCPCQFRCVLIFVWVWDLGNLRNANFTLISVFKVLFRKQWSIFFHCFLCKTLKTVNRVKTRESFFVIKSENKNVKQKNIFTNEPLYFFLFDKLARINWKLCSLDDEINKWTGVRYAFQIELGFIAFWWYSGLKLENYYWSIYC